MNDCHVIGTSTGIFVTRSIRRLPDSFHLEALGEITAAPWDYGYANLGHRLVYSKRITQPTATAVGAELKLGDRDALAVRDYARAHPYEDVDATAISAEAGEPSSAAGAQPEAPSTAAGPVTPADGPPSVAADSAMPAGDVSAETHKHETEHEASGSSPKRAHLETFPHGDVVPQTPVETGHEVLDDIPFERMMSPEKSPKRDGDSVRQIEHLDIEPHVSLESDDLDILIEHELDLSEDPYDVDLNMAASLKELSYTLSKNLMCQQMNFSAWTPLQTRLRFKG